MRLYLIFSLFLPALVFASPNPYPFHGGAVSQMSFDYWRGQPIVRAKAVLDSSKIDSLNGIGKSFFGRRTMTFSSSTMGKLTLNAISKGTVFGGVAMGALALANLYYEKNSGKIIDRLSEPGFTPNLIYSFSRNTSYTLNFHYDFSPCYNVANSNGVFIASSSPVFLGNCAASVITNYMTGWFNLGEPIVDYRSHFVYGHVFDVSIHRDQYYGCPIAPCEPSSDLRSGVISIGRLIPSENLHDFSVSDSLSSQPLSDAQVWDRVSPHLPNGSDVGSVFRDPATGKFYNTPELQDASDDFENDVFNRYGDEAVDTVDVNPEGDDSSLDDDELEDEEPLLDDAELEKLRDSGEDFVSLDISLPDLNSVNFSSNSSCPSSRSIAGFTFDFSIFCGLASDFRPVVMLLCSVASISIFVGGIRV